MRTRTIVLLWLKETKSVILNEVEGCSIERFYKKENIIKLIYSMVRGRRLSFSKRDL